MYLILALAIFLTVASHSVADAKITDAASKTLYVFDLTYTTKLDRTDPAQCRKIWDDTHFAASVQGIVNRKEPRLYVYLVGKEGHIDKFWLGKMREKDGWLADHRLEVIPDVISLAKRFRTDINGLVVYDEKVPATSNVASTIAGLNDFACVRYDTSPGSLYRRLALDSEGPRIPIKAWLVNRDGTSVFTGKGKIPGLDTPSTGSAKCDAYVWAKEKFLDTGRCNPKKLGYYIDAHWISHPEGDIPNHTLTNHDYFIAHKGFFVDLSPWDDETPNDDPDQPLGTDLNTFKAVLRSIWEQTEGKSVIHMGGFVPWDKKYTRHVGGKHGDVESEWRQAEIISCFNTYKDADAIGFSAMASASVFQHFPLKDHYPQKLPTIEDLKARGHILPDGKVAPKSYVYIYVGDYDSAAWFYRHMPEFWNDPARGTVPLGWAFNPNLADRCAFGMDYVRRNASELDYFVAGDNGAGYLNPQYLVEPRPHSGLPSGLEAWERHCCEYYQRWGLSLTGFIIDGNTPPMSDEVVNAYKEFSPDGFVAVKVPEQWGLRNGVPYVRLAADIGVFGSPEPASNIILERLGGRKPEFFVFRTILWTPTDLRKLYSLIENSAKGKDTAVVDPYTLMLLVRQHEESR